MIVKNLTQETIISTDCKGAKSLEDQVLGLLKKSNPRSLLFKTRFGIHTFGLRDEIDVLVLNQQRRVVKLATVKPNFYFFWNPKYNLVIELPKGAIKKSKTKLGDLITY